MQALYKDLEAVHELETFYGDTTLQNLIAHSRQIVEDIKQFEEIYRLTEEGVEIEDNGVRETNSKYRKAIDEKIKSLIQMHRSHAITLKGTTEKRIEQVKETLTVLV